MSGLGAVVLRLLRYPPPTKEPEGSPGTLRVLRPSPRYVWYRLARSLPLAVALFAAEEALRHALVRKLSAKTGVAPLDGVWLMLAVAVTFVILVVVPAAFQAYRIFLEYSVRSYKLTDRALRVREGLIRVRETTMTFTNVQSVVIARGPLQGLFGISDVVVRSAGGGDAGGMHIVRFEAMPEAAEVEALLHELVKRASDPPREPVADASSTLRDFVDAARALRERAESLATAPG